jgi:hypothetical protein
MAQRHLKASRELARLQTVQFLPNFFQPVLPTLVLRPSINVVYRARLPIQSIRLEYSVYFILKGLDSSFRGFCHRQRFPRRLQGARRRHQYSVLGN